MNPTLTELLMRARAEELRGAAPRRRERRSPILARLVRREHALRWSRAGRLRGLHLPREHAS
ncbi:MAG TPA: hypothetical protein VL977_04670 [Solirubrobacteraceae bacterium]|nr:hypothetical protein [Solirubrobacteraceae bacterium]